MINVKQAVMLLDSAGISIDEKALNSLIKEIPTLETTLEVAGKSVTTVLTTTALERDKYYRRNSDLRDKYSALRSEVEQIVHDFGYSIIDGYIKKNPTLR